MAERGAGDGLPSPFADDVLEIVDAIPEGMAVTYGDIAEMLGAGGARGVGNVMARYGSGVPWWRVVRSDGRPAQGHEDEAMAAFRSEGTPLIGGTLGGRRVDLARARWSGPTR